MDAYALHARKPAQFGGRLFLFEFIQVLVFGLSYIALHIAETSMLPAKDSVGDRHPASARQGRISPNKCP